MIGLILIALGVASLMFSRFLYWESNTRNVGGLLIVEGLLAAIYLTTASGPMIHYGIIVALIVVGIPIAYYAIRIYSVVSD